MMDIIVKAFAILGGGVALAAVALGLFVAWVWTTHHWPVGFICSRRTPTNLDMPGRSKPVNLFLGLTSRGKDRWFLGLMLIDKATGEPRRPRIITKKATTPKEPSHD